MGHIITPATAFRGRPHDRRGPLQSQQATIRFSGRQQTPRFGSFPVFRTGPHGGCSSSSSSGTCHSHTAPTKTAQQSHKTKDGQLACHFGFGRNIRQSPQMAALAMHVMQERWTTDRRVAFGFKRVRKPTFFCGPGGSEREGRGGRITSRIVGDKRGSGHRSLSIACGLGWRGRC